MPGKSAPWRNNPYDVEPNQPDNPLKDSARAYWRRQKGGFSTRGPLPDAVGINGFSGSVSEQTKLSIEHNSWKPIVFWITGEECLRGMRYDGVAPLTSEGHELRERKSAFDQITIEARRLGLTLCSKPWDGVRSPQEARQSTDTTINWSIKRVPLDTVLDVIDANPGITVDMLVDKVYRDGYDQWTPPAQLAAKAKATTAVHRLIKLGSIFKRRNAEGERAFYTKEAASRSFQERLEGLPPVTRSLPLLEARIGGEALREALRDVIKDDSLIELDKDQTFWRDLMVTCYDKAVGIDQKPKSTPPKPPATLDMLVPTEEDEN
jgi:hypothetical protein